MVGRLASNWLDDGAPELKLLNGEIIGSVQLQCVLKYILIRNGKGY